MSSKTFKLASSAAAIAAVIALTATAFTAEAPTKDEVFAVTSLVTGFGSQKIVSFDISFVDAQSSFSGHNGLYLLADRTNKAIDVVDPGTNALIHQFNGFVGNTGDNDTSGPDGVFTVEHRFVWAGDGNSTFKVIDLQGVNATQTITVPGGAFRVDEGCWDSRDNIVLWANDAEHDNPAKWPFITFWDSKTLAQLGGAITMDGNGGRPKATNGIEQCQWSPVTGKFYLNIPEVNGPGDDSVAGAVLVIDPISRTIEKTWIINHDACAGPQGMAIGPNNQILLGCNEASGNGKHSTVMINTNTGAIIAVLDNESGADEVWYNEGDGQYFLARSNTKAYLADQQLGVVDSVGHREDQSVPTAIAGTINAHSVAADPVKNQVYVPIPGANTAHPNGASTVCGLHGGSNTQGCIAVLTTTNNDRPRIVRERPLDDSQE